MKTLFTFLALFFLSFFLHAQEEQFFAEQVGDTLKIWNTRAYEECAFVAAFDVEINSNSVRIIERDTLAEAVYCLCYFDFCISIFNDLPAGDIHISFYRAQYDSDPYFVGATVFNNNPVMIFAEPVITYHQSSCYELDTLQYPPPLNFDFDYSYISLGEWGGCNDSLVEGPYYCSHFSWDIPDTATASGDLGYYKVYYENSYTGDTILVGTTEETNLEIDLGVTGTVWVTAVYSSPYGESPPSNTKINDDIPFSVEDEIADDFDILYNAERHIAKIKSRNQVENLFIYDVQGRLFELINFPNDEISLERFPEGMYILKLIMKNKKRYQKRVIR